jgi:hypothetical protein
VLSQILLLVAEGNEITLTQTAPEGKNEVGNESHFNSGKGDLNAILVQVTGERKHSISFP